MFIFLSYPKIDLAVNLKNRKSNLKLVEIKTEKFIR